MSLETIEITADNYGPTITLNSGPTPSNMPPPVLQPSVNFGPGIELLMNDKNKLNGNKSPSSPSADIHLDDLDNLAKELDGISSSKPKSSLREFRSTFFSSASAGASAGAGAGASAGAGAGGAGIEINKDSIPSNDNIKLTIGTESKGSASEQKTWDGFQQFNDIPINPDKQNHEPQLSQGDLLREKFDILRKLEAIELKGIKLSKRYTMESSFLEMKGEYETIKNEKEKNNSVKFQGRMLMAAITGLEFLNNKFDPFDLRLDGWAEQVNENVDDYDDIFGELHEKYQNKAKMAPELKLLFQLSGSAIMLHMTNTMFKSAMPGMDDIMRQNPELMQQFTQAAVNQMGEENPGFGGFMNNIMNPDVMPPSGPPPRTFKTQGAGSVPVPKRQGDISNRPDIGFGRGQPEEGMNINNMFENTNSGNNSGNNSKSIRRPEMKGPSDISSILSGLKTKPPTNRPPSPNQDNSSTISIHDLMDLQNTNKPSRSKRRPKSEKNTISLDI